MVFLFCSHFTLLDNQLDIMYLYIPSVYLTLAFKTDIYECVISFFDDLFYKLWALIKWLFSMTSSSNFCLDFCWVLIYDISLIFFNDFTIPFFLDLVIRILQFVGISFLLSLSFYESFFLERFSSDMYLWWLIFQDLHQSHETFKSWFEIQKDM